MQGLLATGSCLLVPLVFILIFILIFLLMLVRSPGDMWATSSGRRSRCLPQRNWRLLPRLWV